MTMEAIKGILAPLASNTKSIQDTLVCILGSSAMDDDLSQAQKLLVVGGAVEMARRASISAWDGFVDCSYFISEGHC
jgi:chaperone BCS1